MPAEGRKEEPYRLQFSMSGHLGTVTASENVVLLESPSKNGWRRNVPIYPHKDRKSSSPFVYKLENPHHQKK